MSWFLELEEQLGLFCKIALCFLCVATAFSSAGMSSLALILASFLLRGFSMIWNQIPPARQTDSLRRRTGHPPEGTVSLGPLFLPNDHRAHFLGVLGLGIWVRF